MSILNRDARGTSIGRLSWKGSVVVGGREVAVAGINPVPGLIRNCGGDLSDTPKALPLHDVTCTDSCELVTFTTQFGSSTLVDAAGQTQITSGDTTVVNGGPLLVKDGREDITQQHDGMVHPGDPTFAYGWVVKRNPRTFAGIDAEGRTVLVTVDGRSTDDLGLSIPRGWRMWPAHSVSSTRSTSTVVDRPPWNFAVS
jgi:hypothetical protein